MSKLSSTVFSFVVCSATLALAQDVGGTRGGQTTSSLPGQSDFANVADAEFVNTAHSTNAAEIKLGKLAQDRATRQTIKNFGKMLENHHALAQKQLEDVGPKAGLSLPREMLSVHKALLGKLQSLSGEDFDVQFIDSMIKGHQEAIATFERELRDGKNAALKSYADMQLPILRAHLQVAIKEQQELAKPNPAP